MDSVFYASLRPRRQTIFILDVVSNILLFVPFGFLWLGGGLSLRTSRRFSGVTWVAGILGLLGGLMIEFGQMFSPRQIASVLAATGFARYGRRILVTLILCVLPGQFCQLIDLTHHAAIGSYPLPSEAASLASSPLGRFEWPYELCV